MLILVVLVRISKDFHLTKSIYDQFSHFILPEIPLVFWCFRGYKMGMLVINGLKKYKIFLKNILRCKVVTGPFR